MYPSKVFLVVKVQDFYKLVDRKCKGARIQNESCKRYLNSFQHISIRSYPVKFQCEALAGMWGRRSGCLEILDNLKSGII